MLQGMLNIKRVGQVEVDHNDRPVDDVMIKKGSILMQWAKMILIGSLRRRKILYLSFVQCRPGLLRDLYLETAVISEDAPWDQGDQGLPPEGQEEGRQECEDQEERRQCQVQGLLCHDTANWLLIPMTPGSVLKVLVHPEDHRQGEGWEAEAVSAPGPAGWCPILKHFWTFHFPILCSGEGAQVICPH